jgi:hypothetical protein
MNVLMLLPIGIHGYYEQSAREFVRGHDIMSTCPFPNIIATFVDIMLRLIGSPPAILHSLEGVVVVGPGFMGASHNLTWSSPISMMPFGAYDHTPHGPYKNF